jgi:hypothetical protein
VKACQECGIEVPETDLWCKACRDKRMEGRDIAPAVPPLLPEEIEGFKVPPTGAMVIDETGREVDALALARRYRNDTRPVGVWKLVQ